MRQELATMIDELAANEENDTATERRKRFNSLQPNAQPQTSIGARR